MNVASPDHKCSHPDVMAWLGHLAVAGSNLLLQRLSNIASAKQSPVGKTVNKISIHILYLVVPVSLFVSAVDHIMMQLSSLGGDV